LPDEPGATPRAELTDVAVIGAGAVGLTLAGRLAQHGIGVEVLEQEADRIRIGSRAICMQRETLETWARLGIGERVAERGIQWRIGRTYHRGRQLFAVELPAHEEHFPPFVNISQSEVEELLEARVAELEARIERLARRREQLGPVNPLAKAEYDEAIAHVEDLERQRRDLEEALAELNGLIRETDRRIREAFEQTFAAAAKNFEEVVQHLFPGGRGRLRLVHPEGPRPVIGGEDVENVAEPDDDAAGEGLDGDPGVEVEVTPAGKSMKRLSLLSGGEKSLVALAFMFAVFLARPCPFYILDEVEAALDDLNIDRFLQLVGRFSDRAQFVVVTHQKRTMDAADALYGVSMGADGVSRVISRKLGDAPVEAVAEEAAA